MQQNTSPTPTHPSDKPFYGKQEAKMIAGIAIIMMVCHHFFGFPETLADGNRFTYILSIRSVSTPQFFASFGKLCVAIFAFCSGYALWVSRYSYKDPNAVVHRGMKLLISYWVVLSLFLLVGLLIGDKLPDGQTLLFNLVGLRTGVWETYVNITFAWYVSFYILWLILSPLTAKLFEKIKSFWLDALILLVWSTGFGLISIYVPYPDPLNTFTPALVGLLFAKYNLFVHIVTRRNIKTWLAFLVIALLMVTRSALILLKVPFFGIFDGLIAGIFILACVSIIHNLKSRKLEEMLVFLGIYSMNIWFLHSMFFTGSKSLQTWLFFPRYWIAVWILGFLFTLAIAILVEHLQRPLLKTYTRFTTRKNTIRQ